MVAQIVIGYMPNTLQGLLSWSPCGVLDSNKQGGIMEKKLIKAINKLFKDQWESMELGSSQTDLVESRVIKTIKDTFKEIKNTDVLAKLKLEEKNLQQYIDLGVYDSEDVAGMETYQVIEMISKRDFSAMDNLIWHYARITLLKELLGHGKYS